LARVEADPIQPIRTVQPVTHSRVDETTDAPPDAAQARSMDIAWSIAALIETVVLVGGLYWIMSGDSTTSLWQRVLTVSVVAALSAAGVALLLAKRSKPND
jgi:hypothetical protein